MRGTPEGHVASRPQQLPGAPGSEALDRAGAWQRSAAESKVIRSPHWSLMDTVISFSAAPVVDRQLGHRSTFRLQ